MNIIQSSSSILNIIKSLFTKNYKGRCIEIGINPISQLSTLDNEGWNNLYIDPINPITNPINIENNTLLNYFVTNFNKDDADLYVFELENKKKICLDLSIEFINLYSNSIKKYSEIKTNCRTLTKVLDDESSNTKNIDILMINTKSNAIDILNSIDFKKYYIQYLIIKKDHSLDILKDYSYSINYKFIKTNNEYNIYSNNNASIHYISSEINIMDLNNDTENPIIYLARGKLGDFINQLSVICEKYHEIGRKGILYIHQTNDDSDFSNGLLNTYNESYNIIKHLYYISDYKIYNNESYDIDLSCWRTKFKGGQSWPIIFNESYNIEWGKHKWLQSSYDSKWSNMNIINVTNYRFPTDNAIHKLYNSIKDDIHNTVFIGFNINDYYHFIQTTNISIPFYKVNDLTELISIISSCKMAYFGLSAPSTIAIALHKYYYILSCNHPVDNALNDFGKQLKYLLDTY